MKSLYGPLKRTVAFQFINHIWSFDHINIYNNTHLPCPKVRLFLQRSTTMHRAITVHKYTRNVRNKFKFS